MQLLGPVDWVYTGVESVIDSLALAFVIQVDLFDYKIVLWPLNSSNSHWTLVVRKLQLWAMRLYDYKLLRICWVSRAFKKANLSLQAIHTDWNDVGFI